VAGAAVLIPAGHPPVNTGGCVSFTFTVNEHIAFGRTPFVAVQFTVVLPTGNVLPDGGVHITVAAGIPVAVTVKLTAAWHCPVVALTTTGLAGQVITGATPICIATSAVDAGHGALLIDHLNTTRPLPVTWVQVAFGVVAFGLKVPVTPPVTIDHEPVPVVGVFPPSPAVVPPGAIVCPPPAVAVVGGWVIVRTTSAVALVQGGLETVHLKVIGPAPPV
jgi:hypothetical protein